MRIKLIVEVPATLSFPVTEAVALLKCFSDYIDDVFCSDEGECLPEKGTFTAWDSDITWEVEK